MEQTLHATIGLLVIIFYLGLAIVGWVRLRSNEPPPPALRAAQGVAHLLLAIQVLLGVGLIARGFLGAINPLHPILGILAIFVLFLPVLVPAFRRNRPLSAAVVPTLILVLAAMAYAIAEARPGAS